MFCTLNFQGLSIGKSTACNVIMPDNQTGALPVLYLLHGLSDDYTGWQRRTSIERYLAAVPLIVVMPDGGRSFYCNDNRPSGMRYEDHIVQDLVGLVDRTFHTIARRGGRAVAGLSMGGYGATMLAMKHPDVFSVASSHSGALGFCTADFKHRKEIVGLLGGATPYQYDLYRLSRRLKRSGRKIAYRMDCGLADSLLEQNRRFHKYLERIGFQHNYNEFPGDHNWQYWDTHIGRTIDFVMKNLHIA